MDQTKFKPGGNVLVVVWFLCVFFVQPSEAVQEGLNQVALKERQIIEINRSLKNVIEENQRLVDVNKNLEEEVNRLRSLRMKGTQEQASKADMLAPVVRDVGEVIKTVPVFQLAKSNFDQPDQFDASPRFDAEPVIQLASADTTTSQPVIQRENKTLDLLTSVDAFSEQDDRLRQDAARAHYNMGNIYFQKGEFEIAAREFYQAVTLMPNDPDAHFNLAFVSGERLNDFRTALKHYRMYLYLSPEAHDLNFVREKIMQAELALRSQVDSPLEDEY